MIGSAKTNETVPGFQSVSSAPQNPRRRGTVPFQDTDSLPKSQRANCSSDAGLCHRVSDLEEIGKYVCNDAAVTFSMHNPPIITKISMSLTICNQKKNLKIKPVFLQYIFLIHLNWSRLHAPEHSRQSRRAGLRYFEVQGSTVNVVYGKSA